MGKLWGRNMDYGKIALGMVQQVVPENLQNVSNQLTSNTNQINTIVTELDNYYVKCLSTDMGALFVVVSGATTGQINLSAVTPRMSTYTPIVGDYVTKGSNILNAEFVLARASAIKGKTFGSVDDRLEDLDADTYFPMTNLITNGNFSNGTTGWSALYGALSVLSNELIYTITTLVPTSRIDSGNDNAIAGHKYYLIGSIYPKYANSTQLCIGSATSSSFAVTPNQWNSISTILTAIDTTKFRFYHATNTNYVVGDTFKYKYCLAIDITLIFGSGNEPIAAQMDSLLSFYLNSWFNGTDNLAKNIKLVPYLLKDIRTKANIVQESVITPTFMNSWLSNSTTVGYYKNSIGKVEFVGSIKLGVLGSSAFTLPVGYRPSQIIRRSCVSNGVFGYLEIGTDGTVKPYGNNTYIEIGAISFRVDA